VSHHLLRRWCWCGHQSSSCPPCCRGGRAGRLLQVRCRSSGTGSSCRCGVGAVERDSPVRKQKPPNRKLQTGQQSHREAGAPQKLDSPPTRAGTLDGGKFQRPATEAPCARRELRSEMQTNSSALRCCGEEEEEESGLALPDRGAPPLYSRAVPHLSVRPCRGNEPGQGGWALGVGCGG